MCHCLDTSTCAENTAKNGLRRQMTFPPHAAQTAIDILSFDAEEETSDMFNGAVMHNDTKCVCSLIHCYTEAKDTTVTVHCIVMISHYT